MLRILAFHIRSYLVVIQRRQHGRVETVVLETTQWLTRETRLHSEQNRTRHGPLMNKLASETRNREGLSHSFPDWADVSFQIWQRPQISSGIVIPRTILQAQRALAEPSRIQCDCPDAILLCSNHGMPGFPPSPQHYTVEVYCRSNQDMVMHSYRWPSK
ncbi:hypothetical protein N658DRAFT_43938 [Parathielavia hyrcaniae]|uniref:Uncharacterized protein n=1 Tax=Parathielavia hyrcaniae TaxID=113614 RepID=A0AAN6T255_9PEZI|nr:hypothetical protein N658DRAFT_43938 [Parathielavia hyrcaniae]